MRSYQYEWAVFLCGLAVILTIQALTPWPWMLLYIPVGGLWGRFTSHITSFLFRDKEKA